MVISKQKPAYLTLEQVSRAILSIFDLILRYLFIVKASGVTNIYLNQVTVTHCCLYADMQKTDFKCYLIGIQ